MILEFDKQCNTMELIELTQKKIHEYEHCLNSLVANTDCHSLNEWWQLMTSTNPTGAETFAELHRSIVDFAIRTEDYQLYKIHEAALSFWKAKTEHESGNFPSCLDALFNVANGLGNLNGIKDEKNAREKLLKKGKIRKKREILNYFREPHLRRLSPPKAAEKIAAMLGAKYGEKALKYDATYDLIREYLKVSKDVLGHAAAVEMEKYWFNLLLAEEKSSSEVVCAEKIEELSALVRGFVEVQMQSIIELVLFEQPNFM